VCPARPTLACSALLLASIAVHAVAQSTPTLDLGKRNARSKYTLGHVLGLQELGDGRVVVSDNKEGVFRLVDLEKGDVGLLGKQGDDPDNYHSASLIFRLPGDSLLLYDPTAANRRFFPVSARGALGTPVPVQTGSGRPRVGVPIGIDQAGALYYVIPETYDSATKTLSGAATVARLLPDAASPQIITTYRTRRADQHVTGLLPYAYHDAIAVRNDGVVARVVADTYRVVWFKDGAEVGKTDPLPYTAIPITAADQQAYKDSISESFKAMMAAGRGMQMNPGGGAPSASGDGPTRTFTFAGPGGGGGGGGGSPIVISGNGNGLSPATVEQAMQAGRAAGDNAAKNGQVVTQNGIVNPADMVGTFPAAKPPIPSFGTPAIFDREGLLWIARERVRGDAVPHYDVVAQGRGLVAHVNLPAGTRLAGFGKGTVYLLRTEDGSDWLERYPAPKLN
jgi:hypothetical protein